VTDFRATSWMKRLGLALAIALPVAAPIRADEARLPPMPKPLEEMAATKTAVPPGQASMEAWGKAHPDCLEWTDSCQVCVGGEKPGCSTVATACVRAANPTCVRQKVATPAPAPAPAPQPQPAPQTQPAPAAPAPIPPPPIAPAPARP
jgi:hypothetical protein